MLCASSTLISTAISTASKPNSVENLMIGFSATEVVSLNGSPTVSPTTVAACSGVPFSFRSTSTYFLALSHDAAGVGHVDRLEQAEHRDRDQVGDEEVRIEEREGQRERHQGDEDVPHAALGVLVQIRTTVLESSMSASVLVEVHVLLDELDGPIGAGGHGLHRGAAEPEDHRAAADEAEQHRGVGQAQVQHARSCRACRMIEKIIVVAPTTAVPMSTGLAVALKVLPAESLASR